MSPSTRAMASAISVRLAGGTTSSFAPWKAQIGSRRIRPASSGLPPPHTGAMAAKRSGCAAASAQVPKPPMLRPVT